VGILRQCPLVGLGVLGLLQLHLEALGAHLEAVHRLDGNLGRVRIVERDEAKALGQAGLLVDEHLGRDHIAEGQERGGQIRVGELLRQMVDEKVAALGS